MSNQLVPAEQSTSLARQDELSVQQVLDRVHKIHEIMKLVMKKGHHYGKIPGTPKPTLLKPGAEILCETFRFAPHYEVLENIHRQDFISYTVRCVLTHVTTGNVVATGIGNCNSFEKKYREYKDGRKRNPYEQDNTLVKMAQKRALVGATLNATAASDVFSQDIEDMPDIPESSQFAPSPQPTLPDSGHEDAPGSTNAPQEVSMGGDRRTGGYISEKQLKRLWAISKKNKWRKEDTQRLVKEVGQKHSIEIKKMSEIPWGTVYDEICNHLEFKQEEVPF